MKWIKKAYVRCIPLCFGVCLSFYGFFVCLFFFFATVTRYPGRALPYIYFHDFIVKIYLILYAKQNKSGLESSQSPVLNRWDCEQSLIFLCKVAALESQAREPR